MRAVELVIQYSWDAETEEEAEATSRAVSEVADEIFTAASRVSGITPSGYYIQTIDLGDDEEDET